LEILKGRELGRYRRRWEDIIKMDHRESVKWTYLVPDRKR
jgi:hypothetical protein